VHRKTAAAQTVRAVLCTIVPRYTCLDGSKVRTGWDCFSHRRGLYTDDERATANRSYHVVFASSLCGLDGNGLSNSRMTFRVLLGSGVQQVKIGVMAGFFVRLGRRFFVPA
jgi:hypothetical protein